jgi:hypothetical protein
MAENITMSKLKLMDNVDEGYEDWLLNFNMEKVKTWMKTLRAVKLDRVDERLRLWKKAPFIGQPQGIRN